MKAVKIAENIYWVGGLDYNIRSFHGYCTNRGVTYNAYLIIDEKITLIDSVKASFAAEMLERISSVIDVSKIDVIISNHAEFDHSGAIKDVYEKSHAKVYATAAGVKTLTTLYGEMDYVTVAPNSSLSIGKHTLTFLPTPMVHWPDNMVTYIAELGLLFSNDAFGQHIATSTRLDTNTNFAEVLHEAKKYFANIVLPYASQVTKAMNAVANLPLKIIAPSHGVVLTNHIPDILALYKDICSGKKDGKAVMVYDSMWGGTEKLAKMIGARLEDKHEVIYADLKANHISDIMTHLATAEILAVGSSTLNNTTMPTVAAFLNYLGGLKPTNLKYIAFGTYGWAGGAVKEICAKLDSLNYTQLNSISYNFIPKDDFDLNI